MYCDTHSADSLRSALGMKTVHGSGRFRPAAILSSSSVAFTSCVVMGVAVVAAVSASMVGIADESGAAVELSLEELFETVADSPESVFVVSSCCSALGGRTAVL